MEQPPKIEKQEQCKPKDEFEELIQYCYHSNLKSLIIHYVLNYYQFIQQNDVKIEKDENKYTFVTPNILPYALSMDSQYFYIYILSDKNIPINNIEPNPGAKLLRISTAVDETSIENRVYINDPMAINIDIKEITMAAILLTSKCKGPRSK